MSLHLNCPKRLPIDVAVLSIGMLLLTSCSTMQPPRYSISVDNLERLRTFEGAQVRVVSLNQQAAYESNCRLFGPIEPADGLSIPAFITKAFNDEFKVARIHSENGTKITGDITRIEFSSVTGLTSGYWHISLDLESSNGETLSISNRYGFKSGFDAITACNATADALTPAVQDLIKEVVSHPKFGKLLQ